MIHVYLFLFETQKSLYCPATQGKHGIISRATDILKAIEVDESLIHPFIGHPETIRYKRLTHLSVPYSLAK